MSMHVAGPFNSGAAVGGNGVATANADTPIRICGWVVGIYVKYNDSPPAGTTDVTVKTKGTSPEPPTYNLLAISNAATSGWFYPRAAVHDTVGAAITGEYTPLLVDDYLNIVIAQANAADNVDVWLMIEKG
jgi:hypothetical protein